MTAHTPGPWLAVEHPPVPQPLMTVSAGLQPVCDLYRGYDKTPERIRADASLIAAAPDLLDALQRAVRYCPVEVQDQMYAVIAKAEGRS